MAAIASSIYSSIQYLFLSLSRPRLSALLSHMSHTTVGNVVLINVAHTVDGLPPDLACGHDLYIIEPLIRIQPRSCCPLPQSGDACRSGIIGCHGKQSSIKPIHLSIHEVLVDDEA